MADQELWNYINDSIKTEENCIKVVIMGMTRWDCNSNDSLPKVHTALGGFPLALFGSGNIYSWPSSIEEIHSCFQNHEKIPNFLFDDSGHRNSMWSNCATGIGAVFHEIGHSFQLRHTKIMCNGKRQQIFKFPVMGRGFDMFNRIFTLSEPFPINSETKKKILLKIEEETNFHMHSVIRLLYNPFFSSSIGFYNKIKLSSLPPLIERERGLICIRSTIGIIEISLYDMKSGDIVYTQPLGIFPPTYYHFSIVNLKKLPFIDHNNPFIGCTAMDIHGNVSNELISLKISKISFGISPIQHLSFSTSMLDDQKSTINNNSICIGSKIKLLHLLTSKYLTSFPEYFYHDNSSNFQVVLCTDDNSHPCDLEWEVVSLSNMKLPYDTPIKCNEHTFGLFHVATKKYLHSHFGHPSPITHQQEACCFGFENDDNNIWSFEPKNKIPNTIWQDGDAVMIHHKLTNSYLHSHGGHANQYTFSLQEVTCYPIQNDDNNYFVAEIIN